MHNYLCWLHIYSQRVDKLVFLFEPPAVLVLVVELTLCNTQVKIHLGINTFVYMRDNNIWLYSVNCYRCSASLKSFFGRCIGSYLSSFTGINCWLKVVFPTWFRLHQWKAPWPRNLWPDPHNQSEREFPWWLLEVFHSSKRYGGV